MNAGVHFVGIEPLMKALERFDAENWVLYQGKQPVVSGADLSELREWLEMFESGGSTATYTVRLYDAQGAHSWAEPAVCSFNFKLIDSYSGMGISGYNIKLAERVKALEEGAGNDDPEDWGEVIMGWFKNPEDLDTVVGAFRKLLGFNSTAQAMGTTNQPTSQPAANTQPATNEEKLQRLSAALDKLEKKDPNLLEHLEKLAAVDDVTFSVIKSKLNAL